MLPMDQQFLYLNLIFFLKSHKLRDSDYNQVLILQYFCLLMVLSINLKDNLKVPCFDLINSVSEIVDKQIIGVLATQTTVRSSYYKKAINSKKENKFIFQQECPEFVL